jgi:hypothetical protein
MSNHSYDGVRINEARTTRTRRFVALLSVLLAASATPGYSQNTFPSSGNVGIGTTTGLDSLLTLNANPVNTSGAGGISMLGVNSQYGFRTTVFDTGQGIQGQFSLKIATVYQPPAMVIGSYGNTQNVGIGTTSPSSCQYSGNQ